MKRLSLLHRFYSALRGEKLFSSSPGHRVSHSRQVVDLPILHFVEPDSFTFEPLVLDVSHLGIGSASNSGGAPNLVAAATS